MAFKEYHGITLADNSWIENLNIERLSTDPETFNSVRIWYNTSENKLKASIEDGSGGYVIIDLQGGSGGDSFIYTSTSPSTNHTITHDLGTQDIDVSLWVLDTTTTKYVNDTTQIVIEDDNNISLEFSIAVDIKVIIKSY